MKRTATTLSIFQRHTSNKMKLEYHIDNEFSGDISIDFDFDISTQDKALHLFNCLGTVFLSQLCLAEKVMCCFSVDGPTFEYILPTICTLYAVRAYRDEIPAIHSPVFVTPNQRPKFSKSTLVSANKAVLLWSGGIDSTLSLMLLRKNGYEVNTLHISNVNGDPKATISELRAVQELGKILSAEAFTSQIQFPQFSDICERYSSNAGTFPQVNTVPHGRELLLLPVAAVYANLTNSDSICFGFENSAWTDQIEYEGALYSRSDTQSEFCLLNLQHFIREVCFMRFRLFSPVAPLSEYYKFSSFVTLYPQLAPKTSFCFWGENCGLCQKCSLYYLLQRSLKVSMINFANNPITLKSPFIIRAMNSWNDINFRERNLALSDITLRGDIEDEEALLTEYSNRVLPHTKPFLDEWRSYLTQAFPVALLPSGFVVP